MTRRVLAVAALVSFAVVLVVSASTAASGQSSADITQVGWWSRRPGAAELPEGGFEVAWGVQGEESVAAVLVVGGIEEPDEVLLILNESAETNVDSAAIRVCTSATTWQAANPGAYEDRPTANCAAATQLGRDSSTSRWIADVTAFVAPGPVSLMLVPVETPVDENLPVAAPYQVTFSGAQLRVSGGSSSPTTTTAFVDGSSDDDASVDEPAVGDQGSFDDSDDGAVVTEPSTTTTAEVTTTSDELAALPISGVSGDDPPWTRLLVLVPISAAAGYGATWLRRVARARGLADAAP